MSGTCQLNGAQFPWDPYEYKWERERLATRGDGAPIWSIYWSFEGKLPHLEQAEWEFFLGYFGQSGNKSVVLPHPGSEVLTTFTDVAFERCEAEHRDHHGWFMSPKVRFSHIYVSGGVIA